MDFHCGGVSKIEGIASMEFAENDGISKTTTDMELVGTAGISMHSMYIYIYICILAFDRP